MIELKKNHCLVATSDDFFWAPDNNIFLSDVFLLDKKNSLNKKKYKVINAFVDNAEAKIMRKEFIIERMPVYRDAIANSIECISSIKINSKEKKIILDLWLFHFLTIVFDRVYCMRKILDNKGNDLFYMYIKNVDAPKSSFEFVNNCQSEKYNQYLYAEAARVVGINIIELSDHNKKPNEKRFFSEFFLRKYAIKILKIFIVLIKPALIITSSVSKINILKVLLKSFGKIWIIPSRYIFETSFELKEDINSRKNLLKVDETDVYDEYANTIIIKTFPLDLFEKFSYYYNSFKGLAKIPIIASDTQHYWNDQYKILAARVSSMNGRVDAIQHGGNYNLYNFSVHSVEASIFDRFYYWNSSQKYSLPSLKIEKIKENNYVPKKQPLKNKILFICCRKKNTYPSPRYMPDSSYTADTNDQASFYNNLNVDLIKNFQIRPNPHGAIDSFFKNWVRSENISIDNSKEIFDSLIDSKIIVLDALSTTWIEVLHLNIPIILVYDYISYDLKADSIEIFQILESINILHKTSKSASEFININFNNIDNWWNETTTINGVNLAKEFLLNDKNLVLSLLYNFSIKKGKLANNE